MNKILITGGNFINKGAQSMLFCVVDSLKKEYPNSDIVMIDLFPSLTSNDKNKYAFEIVNMHIRTVLRLGFPIVKLLVKPKPISNPEKEIMEHFKTADLVFDISGYGVSSHNQHPLWTYATLFPVKVAKKFNVPFVFLPQSIGPFNFKGWKKLILFPFIKKYLNYPKKIFIREPKCRVELSKIRTEGVIDSFDIVLQSEKVDINNIHKAHSNTAHYEVKEDSIIIIPNKQLTKLRPQSEVISLFSELCNHLSEKGHNISIIRHSADDEQICNAIFEETKKTNIQLINEDLDPYEIQQLLAQSSIVIASIYHVLIHSLKLGKPCLVIGWAHKYEHVMKSLNLMDYYFSVTDSTTKGIIESTDKLLNNKASLNKSIKKNLEEIKGINLYKDIK